MIQNYLKIAWRNLVRNRGFSLINILGLTIGMTCSILIFIWVKDELGYNKFHANYKELYQVMAHRDFNNQVFTDESMVLPLAKALESSAPQVKNATVITHDYSAILEYRNTKLKKYGHTVSEHFFNVFSWKFLRGSASSLQDPSSMALTQSAARSLFGNVDPINKIVRINNDRNATITAVLADPPSNSTLQFDFIVPFNYSDPSVQRSMNEWTSSSWQVFVQVVPGTGINVLNDNINKIKKSKQEDKYSTYFAFPMNKWRLYSDWKDGKNIGGMIEYVRLFSIIAIVILLIACINFMNLSTARSEKRAKEVGIRKTLGSAKKQLVIQFFSETIILALVAFMFSIVAVFLLLPSFNLLVDKKLNLPVTQIYFWIAAVIIIFFTGIVAGSYPALFLSSFNPVKVLKGTFAAGKKAILPRRILVVGQFAISILLISATIIVYQQIQFIKNRHIGYNPDNLIMMPNSPDIAKNFTVIKQELLKTGIISSVTRTSSPITSIWWRDASPDYKGKPENAETIVTSMTADVDFTKTMGIKIIEGTDFSGSPSDSTSMILNKAAVTAMSLKNPVGMQMRKGRKNFTVIGITDNVIMESPFKPVDPMVMYFNPKNSSTVSVRLKEKVTPQKALALLESVFKKYNPAFPFEYQFVDQEFGKKFLSEERISKITNIFAALAIFICCLGVAGLAAFTIQKRIREIGIRKVLGASFQQLLLLISTEFLRLVAIAFIIAVPLTWWFMDNWLEKFDFKVSISIWLFAVVGIIILLLTLFIVGLNTMRAVMANPVKSLRTE